MSKLHIISVMQNGKSKNAPEELGLGRGGIADHEHVDVPAEVRPVRQGLLHACF
jgi:hypothetical protein